MTIRDAIMRAIVQALETRVDKVLRNAPLPATVPPRGLVIVRDGDPGEPWIGLPLSYTYAHAVEIEAYAQPRAAAAQVATLDGVVADVAAALAADPTFGGLAEWSEPAAPIIVEQGQPGADPVAAATIALRVTYTLPHPLA
jgi:hypothetical protein